MSDQSAPPRQPGHVWDRKYQDFSKAQHAKAKAIGERIAKEPVTLSTLGDTLAAEVDQMVVDADAMAETRYNELAAERNSLEAALVARDQALADYATREKAAALAHAALKKAMTDKGIKLP